MRHFCAIGTLLMTAVLAACNPSVVEPEGRPCRELSAIDSLLWTQPDSALTRLLLCYDTVSDRHYANLLLAELLYKNDYAQTNRAELLEAVAHYDSLPCPFLAARSHYINGVGYYERDSVVAACEEYLKAVEIMEESFPKKDLVGKKAKFMAYSYNRLGELFSGQFIIESAIDCYENALVYCKIEPTSPTGISNTLYRIGVLYDEKGETEKARSCFDQALGELKYTDNLLYRDIVSSKAIVDYQLGMDSKQVLDELRMVIAQADNEKELLHRFLTIGAVFMGEGVYDSVLLYFVPVFQNEMNIASKIQVAESLRIIYDSLGNKGKTYEYVQFLANQKKSDGESKALVSKLEDVFQNYRIKKNNNQVKILRGKVVMKTIIIVIPIVVLIVLCIIAIAKRASKKLLKQQQEEADKVFGEMEQGYKEELKRLQTETEQRLEELEKKHHLWMVEAGERHEVELKAQKDKSEKEIEKIKIRHNRELEVERLTYEKEQKAVRLVLLEREEQIGTLEMALDQQRVDAKWQRAAFIKEPICQEILCKVRNKHITTRDNAYEFGVALGDEGFMQLKEAVAKHYDGFDNVLISKCDSLKPGDLTLCHLYLLGLSEVAIAALKNRTYSAIKKQKNSIEDKLGIEESLSKYVLSVADGICPSIGSQKSSQKILELISTSPSITLSEVAKRVGLTRRGVDKNIKQLKEQGLIRRVGPNKGGRWEITK